MKRSDKPLVWLHGEVKSPPFSLKARIETGFVLRQLQAGKSLSPRHSRPMPAIGVRCHELRINDENKTWRIVYRIDPDAIIILDVFEKRPAKTPSDVMENCRRRLHLYES